jgi:hypothetical protein
MLNLKSKIALIIILLTGTIYSQNLAIGLSGGINYSIPKITEFEAQKEICPLIKLTSDFYLSKNFYLQLGAGYVQHSYSIDIFPDINLTFNYIDVSLAAKYKYKNFFVIAGSMIDIYINGATHINNYSINFDKTFSESLLYGLFGGIGFELSLGRNFNLLLQSDYTVGLKDATKSDDIEVKFNGINFLAGLNYNF